MKLLQNPFVYALAILFFIFPTQYSGALFFRLLKSYLFIDITFLNRGEILFFFIFYFFIGFIFLSSRKFSTICLSLFIALVFGTIIVFVFYPGEFIDLYQAIQIVYILMALVVIFLGASMGKLVKRFIFRKK